jgi:chromosome segregation ATPase
MKKKLTMLLFTAFVAGTVLTACQPNEKKLENDQENIRDAEQKFAEDWAKYKDEQDKKIRDNEDQIARIRERMKDNKDEKYRATVEQRTNELEEKNKAMRARIDTYDKEKQREKWDDFKREFNHDMDELGNSLRDLGKDNVK